MVNLYQKTKLHDVGYDQIKDICSKFRDESGASDMEVKLY